ncbi:hypothetical protein, partial [Xanthomonas hortorum]
RMTHINPLRAKASYNVMLEVPTLSGQRVNLFDPSPSTIRIEDISTGLSNCCRFVGQLANFYSVAQHSVVVSRIVHPRLALHGLLHDASEAYMHHLGPAVKNLVGSLYRPIEDQLQDVIYRAYGLPPLSAEDMAHLKCADRQANAAEMRHFGIAPAEPFSEGLDHMLDEPIIPLDPRPARTCFTRRFDELY